MKAASNVSRALPGTGLPFPLYGALVLFSVTLFLVWGGPLWLAPHGASHVGRFAVSYLAVIPCGALLLASVRRLTLDHLVATTGSTWSIKLVITSLLYFGLAPSTSLGLHADAPPPAAAPTRTVEYEAQAAPFRGGDLDVSAPGLQQGVVLAEHPRPGLDLTDPPTRATRIVGARYEQAIWLAFAGQPLAIENADPQLHTVHLHRGGRSIANLPIPAGTRQQVLAPEPGEYDVGCDNHPGEHATLVVVDHPYAAELDAAGRATLRGLPAGETQVLLVSWGPNGLVRREGKMTITAGSSAKLVLDATQEGSSQRTP